MATLRIDGPVVDEQGVQDEAALARGLRAGSREAWAALYDRYSVDVWRYVARRIGPQAVADVVQEVFIAAARSARQFDASKGTLWSWLSGIAHHHVLSHWRSARKQGAVRTLTETELAETRRLFDTSVPLEELQERRWLAELVRHVLVDLPDDYAALLTGKYLDELSLDDLARRSGSSLDAVKSKLARARREFRAKFDHLTREPTSAAPRESSPSLTTDPPVAEQPTPLPHV